jgi:hypothetical protein
VLPLAEIGPAIALLDLAPGVTPGAPRPRP